MLMESRFLHRELSHHNARFVLRELSHHNAVQLPTSTNRGCRKQPGHSTVQRTTNRNKCFPSMLFALSPCNFLVLARCGHPSNFNLGQLEALLTSSQQAF